MWWSIAGVTIAGIAALVGALADTRETWAKVLVCAAAMAGAIVGVGAAVDTEHASNDLRKQVSDLGSELTTLNKVSGNHRFFVQINEVPIKNDRAHQELIATRKGILKQFGVADDDSIVAIIPEANRPGWEVMTFGRHLSFAEAALYLNVAQLHALPNGRALIRLE